jgi:hypothetical protein
MRPSATPRGAARVSRASESLGHNQQSLEVRHIDVGDPVCQHVIAGHRLSRECCGSSQRPPAVGIEQHPDLTVGDHLGRLAVHGQSRGEELRAAAMSRYLDTYTSMT